MSRCTFNRKAMESSQDTTASPSVFEVEPPVPCLTTAVRVLHLDLCPATTAGTKVALQYLSIASCKHLYVIRVTRTFCNAFASLGTTATLLKHEGTCDSNRCVNLPNVT